MRSDLIKSDIIHEFLIPLQIISLAKKELRGKVRLQKLIFLTQEKSKQKLDFNFEPAPLGPLSDHVNYMLVKMNELGLIEERKELTKSGNDVFCYKITSSGNKLLEFASASNMLNNDTVEAINSVYREYGTMPYVDLLNYVHEAYPKYHLKNITI